MPALRYRNAAAIPPVPYEQCWAKTTADGLPGIGVGPHCRNVGYVARALLDVMPRGIRELFPRGAVALAAAHDIGKISPEFQAQCAAWCEGRELGNRPLLKADHAACTQFTLRELIQIQLQETCSDQAFLCERFNQRTVQSEVIRPALPARVEERNQGAGGVLKRTEIAPFPGIATHAGVREIIRFRSPAMLAADNVIDLVRGVRVLLMQKTILTAVGRSFRDQAAKRVVDITGQARGGAEPVLWPG